MDRLSFKRCNSPTDHTVSTTDMTLNQHEKNVSTCVCWDASFFLLLSFIILLVSILTVGHLLKLKILSIWSKSIRLSKTESSFSGKGVW